MKRPSRQGNRACRRTRPRLAALFFLAAAVSHWAAGCGSDSASPSPADDGLVESWRDPDVETDPLDVTLGPQPKRLHVDELRNSLRVVTQRDDGSKQAKHQATPWRVPVYLTNDSQREVYRNYQPLEATTDSCWRPDGNYLHAYECDGFNDAVFGRTLGRPDYDGIPSASKSINATYVKLGRDMAWNVCKQMSEADAFRDNVDDNVLTPGFAIDEAPSESHKRSNLQELVLRFHGVDRSLDEPALGALEKLFDDIVQGTSSDPKQTKNPYQQAWNGVCIALFEDPLFHLR